MKRKIIIFSALIGLLLFIPLMFSIRMINTSKANQSFELKDYQQYISKYPSQKIMGYIPNCKVAKNTAIIIWQELYGEAIKDKRPYQVFFDEEEKVWLVHGSLMSFQEGGVPYLLVEMETGKVLAVWHSK